MTPRSAWPGHWDGDTHEALLWHSLALGEDSRPGRTPHAGGEPQARALVPAELGKATDPSSRLLLPRPSSPGPTPASSPRGGPSPSFPPAAPHAPGRKAGNTRAFLGLGACGHLGRDRCSGPVKTPGAARSATLGLTPERLQGSGHARSLHVTPVQLGRAAQQGTRHRAGAGVAQSVEWIQRPQTQRLEGRPTPRADSGKRRPISGHLRSQGTRVSFLLISDDASAPSLSPRLSLCPCVPLSLCPCPPRFSPAHPGAAPNHP